MGGGGGRVHPFSAPTPTPLLQPFGPWCLYSQRNYTPGAHPPLVGFSLDGFAIYGRYLNASAPDYAIPLDLCGGHAHDGMAYHYHAQTVPGVTTAGLFGGIAAGLHYPQSVFGPFQCWRGNISADPYFNAPNNSPANQPCCGSSEWYAAPGITIKGAVSHSTTPTASSAPSTPAGSASPVATGAPSGTPVLSNAGSPVVSGTVSGTPVVSSTVSGSPAVGTASSGTPSPGAGTPTASLPASSTESATPGGATTSTSRSPAASGTVPASPAGSGSTAGTPAGTLSGTAPPGSPTPSTTGGAPSPSRTALPSPSPLQVIANEVDAVVSLTLSGLSQSMANNLYAATASDLATAVGAASKVITAAGQTFDVTVQGVALNFPVDGPSADGIVLQLAVTMYAAPTRRELEGDARSLAGVYVGSSTTAAVVSTPAQLNAALATTSGGAFLAALWATPLFVSAAAAANVAAQPATFHAVAASAPASAAPASTSSNSVAVGVGVAVGVVVLAVAVLVVIRARRGKSPMGGSKTAATTSSDWAGPTPNPVKVKRGAFPTAPV